MDLPKPTTTQILLTFLLAAVFLIMAIHFSATPPPKPAVPASESVVVITANHKDGTCSVLSGPAATVQDGDILQITGSPANCSWFDPETDSCSLVPGATLALKKRSTGYFLSYTGSDGQPAYLSLLF